MSKHSNTWFYRFRKGGDMAETSVREREQILELWAAGKTKKEISEAMNIHVNTIRKATRLARMAGDERGFAKTRPLSTSFSCDSVLELQNQQWFIKGLAEKFDIHFTQMESAVRAVVNEIKARDEK